ncbi:N-arachidonyl glycine receptor-like [Paramacrobiotus metropolitanus]|uniref:N-arachidonyl glycine receptor-like n=1 Tax=Paramacrobiotus metropolitanus TaxID=2943436 RepID=UPI0024455FF7|nr:N-arachidonyl glycine receptor-like [Paramacrobiotus metropolitanus]
MLNNSTFPIHVSAVPWGDSDLSKMIWNWSTIVKLCIFMLTILLNGIVLFAYVVNRELRTPFTVYVMNLLTINILFAGLDMPFATIFTALPSWFPGWRVCAVYQYMLYPLAACQLWSQTLVTINRIWAAFHPFSYRSVHSFRIALTTCATVWLITHIVGLPYVVLDVVWHRTPAPYHCALNEAAQPVTARAFELVMIDLTVVIIWAAYPLLFWKLWQRLRKKAKIAIPSTRMVNVTVRTDGSDPNNFGDGVYAQRRMSRRKETSKSISMLSMLTVSTSVCYTPFHAFFFALAWTAIQPSFLWFNVASMLYIIQPLLDPVFFIIGLDNLRVSLTQMFVRRRK